MKPGKFSVRQVAEASVPDIVIKDNGDGRPLFTGPGFEVKDSPFADLPVAYIGIDFRRRLVLSIHHDEVEKLRQQA